jgi:hypothetical protein
MYLTQGEQFKNGFGYGLAHIEARNGEDFYRVNSAFPVSSTYTTGKAKKEGWEPLWSKYPVLADAFGASGFANKSSLSG